MLQIDSIPVMMNIPDADRAIIQRCQELVGEGKYVEALAIAREWLDGATDDETRWNAYTVIGNYCRRMEMWAESIEAHGAALALASDPYRTAAVWTNLGCTFLCASSWDVAIECFHRVTENPKLATAAPQYVSQGNLAVCYLHMGDITAGLQAARRALALETPALIAKSPHGPVLYRHTFVQLSLLSNRVTRAEMDRRAAEAFGIAAANPQVRNQILMAAIDAEIDAAFGDRERGITRLQALLPTARECPEILPDILFALVQAERLAGHPGKAAAHLREWLQHLFPEATTVAADFGLTGWLLAGEPLHKLLSELTVRPTLPAALVKLLEAS